MDIGKNAFKLFKIVSDAALPFPINSAYINGSILVAADNWCLFHKSSNWTWILPLVLIFYFNGPPPWRSLLSDVAYDIVN